MEKVPILAQPFLSIPIFFSVIWIVVAVPALATSIQSASLPTDYGGIQALWVSGRETFPLTCQVTPESSAKLFIHSAFSLRHTIVTCKGPWLFPISTESKHTHTHL